MQIDPDVSKSRQEWLSTWRRSGISSRPRTVSTPRGRGLTGRQAPASGSHRGRQAHRLRHRPICSPQPMAIEKALVFYSGKPPKSEKTNWIMHEYRVADVDRSARKKNHSLQVCPTCTIKRKDVRIQTRHRVARRHLQLDDWALCRIYHKKRRGEVGQPEEPPSAGGSPAAKVRGPPAGGGDRHDLLRLVRVAAAVLLGESSSSGHALSSPEFMC